LRKENIKKKPGLWICLVALHALQKTFDQAATAFEEAKAILMRCGQ